MAGMRCSTWEGKACMVTEDKDALQAMLHVYHSTRCVHRRCVLCSCAREPYLLQELLLLLGLLCQLLLPDPGFLLSHLWPATTFDCGHEGHMAAVKCRAGRTRWILPAACPLPAVLAAALVACNAAWAAAPTSRHLEHIPHLRCPPARHCHWARSLSLEGLLSAACA